MDITKFKDVTHTLGFCRPGQPPQNTPVVTSLPEQVVGEQSICGIKEILVHEVRVFPSPDGTPVEIPCASMAVLDITDSPVHVHGETVESYTVLHGEGLMVLNEDVISIRAGVFVTLPPGVAHGLAAAEDGRPVRVLLSFSPGLSPITHPRYRDEKILFPSARVRAAELAGRPRPDLFD